MGTYYITTGTLKAWICTGMSPIDAARNGMRELHENAEAEFLLGPSIQISISPSGGMRSDTWIGQERYMEVFSFLYDGTRDIRYAVPDRV